MYEENDYIMRQIKAMVRGLGKFMGLEQIKELLQINQEEQVTITDLELETIIATSKLELILQNSQTSLKNLSIETNIDEESLEQILNHKISAGQEEINQLNDFIKKYQQYL